MQRPFGDAKTEMSSQEGLEKMEDVGRKTNMLPAICLIHFFLFRLLQ